MHRILIVEDHQLLLEGMKSMIEKQAELSVCGEAHGVEDAKRVFHEVGPDLVIIDLSLMQSNGLELVKYLAKLPRKVKILVFSNRPAWIMANRVFKAGAHGYLRKSPADNRLPDAISAVLAGERYVSEGAHEEVVPEGHYVRGVEDLSDQEFDIFDMVGHGLRPGDIATKLGCKTNTVKTHLQRMQDKLGVVSAEQLKTIALAWQLEAVL